MHVSWHHAAEGELHQIATHQFRGGYGFPDSIAADGRVESETRLQGSEGGLSAALLKPGQSCVEDQQDCDDGSLEVLVQ
jgi:hypothetical protein